MVIYQEIEDWNYEVGDYLEKVIAEQHDNSFESWQSEDENVEDKVMDIDLAWLGMA